MFLTYFYIFSNIASSVVLALILTTGFISMWMQNTITTAIMLPIAKAIVEEFEVVSCPFVSSELRNI